MARKSRRLQTLERQHRVAVIARREAVGALAQAQASETQSSKLADHSRELARTYGKCDGEHLGHDLTHIGKFAGALAIIASDAERSCLESAQQRDLAAANLSQRESRLDRIEDHLASEKREADRSAQLRETTDQAMLARKLLR